MPRKGLNCFCQGKESIKSSNKVSLSLNITTEDLTKCGNWVKRKRHCKCNNLVSLQFRQHSSCLCLRGFLTRFHRSDDLFRQRQTMYDFVNEWSPGGQQNRQVGHWPTKVHLFHEPLKFFSSKSKESKYINLDLDQENCQCTNHAKTSRRRRLRSKSGFYLTIMPNGQVLGVKDPTNVYISLDVIPVGADLVKIWGVEAELFLMIDDAGLLRATDVDSPECVFEETMTEDFCTVYYSAMYSHKQWCVGLKTRPLSTFSGAFRRNKLSLRDCSFLAEIVNRRSSTSSSQSCSSDGKMAV